MKRNVILVVDADTDTASLIGSVAALLNLDVRFACSARHLFQLIKNGLDDVGVIVLDVDPGVHAMAALEALAAWEPAPPVIVISSLEEAHLHPVAIAHGAKECLGKPVSLPRVKGAIAKLARVPEARDCRCDLWGHPCEACTERRSVPNERQLPLLVAEH